MTKWGPIGEEVFIRTYQRDGASWGETVRRVVYGNKSLLPHYEEYPGGNTDEEYLEAIESFKMLPGGRHLWASGVPGRQFLFNCHRAGWSEDITEHFCFVFDELMKGGGVGANYSNCYIEQLPTIKPSAEVSFLCSKAHPDWSEVDPDPYSLSPTPLHHVPDTREGWVDALRALLQHHAKGHSTRLAVDVSHVRPSGEPIRGFGGTASGPGPLVEALRTIDDILRTAVGRQLTSLEAMEIDHALASCVIAGNVRRSARMSMKHWKDPDIFQFINCKADTGSHWSTNISVEVDDEFWKQESVHARNALSAIVDGMLRNGEPGFFNSSRAKIGEIEDVRCTNPCGEIALQEWENCNLGNLNLAFLTDKEELHRHARMMTRFLIRATFSDSVTDPKQQLVLKQNRRIGVGLMGFQEWLILRHNLKFSDLKYPHRAKEVRQELTELYQVIREEADRYSRFLGIPAPIKVTCVAPTGTVSQLCGVTAGIHPVYAKHFIRRVRYSKNDPNLYGKAWEDDLYSDNTAVVSFVCRDQIFDLIPPEKHHLIQSADELGVADHLAVLELVQNSYADNAVSYTANVPPDLSPASLYNALQLFGPFLKGVTIMPDGTRPQAPFERLSAPAPEARTDASFDECSTGACPVR